MTLTRLVIVLAVGLLTIDYKFGDGRLIQYCSVQASELAYKLNDAFSGIVRRIGP